MNYLKDINNIAWCPTKGNAQLRQTDREETFLVSSSFDKWIKIWAVAEGKCVIQAKLPINTGIHRPKPSEKRSTWIALHWLNEETILSSGLSGELLSWNVSRIISNPELKTKYFVKNTVSHEFKYFCLYR